MKDYVDRHWLCWHIIRMELVQLVAALDELADQVEQVP